MRVCLIICLLLAAPQLARAQEAHRLNLSAMVATDYVSRGLSRSEGRASAGVGADLTKNDFYGGAWVSTVGGLDGEDAEVLVYGGWRPDRWGYSFDLGAIGRFYPGVDRQVSGAFLEPQASVSQTIGPLQYGGRLVYTLRASGLPGVAPPAPSERGDGLYLELNGAYDLTRKLNASAAVGRQDNSYDALDRAGRRSTASFDTWNLGVAYDLNDHLNLDLRYWDTDAHGLGANYRSRLVGSLTAIF